MLIPHQTLSITASDIVSGTLNYITKSKSYSQLNKHIPLKYRYWTSSGRNALKLVLKHIKANRVGVSAFTCKVVDTAIKSAGCKPFYTDSGPIMNIKDIKIIIKDIDTLVVPYNFGFIPKCDKISNLCKKNHVTLIEDCAASLGAKYKNRLAGTFGDYSIYSFGIGKGGFLGGMIGSNEELNTHEPQNYPKSEILYLMMKGILAQPAFNPKLHKLFHSASQKDIRRIQKQLNYEFPKIAEYINLQILERLNKTIDIRTKNANILMKELEGVIDFIKPLKDSNPSWLFFVFMVKNRSEFMKSLYKKKIDISPLLDYKDLSNKSKKAQDSVNKHTTFALNRPINQIEYLIKKIKEVCKNGNY